MSALYEEIRRRYADPRVFVRTLKERMARHGITQSDLVRRGGFDQPQVSSWLGSGRVMPRMEAMVLLDETVDRLIRGE